MLPGDKKVQPWQGTDFDPYQPIFFAARHTEPTAFAEQFENRDLTSAG
jgi:hypothetical protein